MAPATTAAVPAANSRRGRRWRAASSTATVNTASSSPPAQPPGQATTAAGIRAPTRATRTSHCAGQLASQARNSPPGSQTGDTTAARTPSTVAGATTGAAARLAAIATRLTVPEMPAMIGETATCAAAGTATASARPAGTPRRRNPSRHRGASSNSPAVATTDRAKPASPANSGSTTMRMSTVAASAGMAARERPTASASNPIEPIAAARTTEAVAWHRITNPTTAAPLSDAVSHGGARPARASRKTKPTTIVHCEPDTARRWVMPVAKKSSLRLGSRALTSPTANAGTRPPTSSGSGSAAARSPARNDSAARCTHGGCPTRCGTPSTEITAAVRSAPRGGARRPAARTRSPGRSRCQAGSVAKRRTRTRVRTGGASATSSRTNQVATSHSGGPALRGRRTGSRRTVTSTVTVA